ncbi:Oxidoreductase family, NAD-binding Rossmann fold [compost metagenome]
MYNIVIIGAGQLGSRHLQSLASINLPLNIYVVDTNPEALNVAKSRFVEMSQLNSKEVTYYTNLDELPLNADLAIVASNSINRKSIIEALLAKCSIKFLLLEKFLFPRLSDYGQVSELLKANKVKAWVNLPRRAFEFYKHISKEINDKIVFTISGTNWGLGCNTIHFLDLFVMLSRPGYLFHTFNGIDNKIVESKRDGYIEFTGEIQLRTDKGDIFNAISYQNGDHPIILRIDSNDQSWVINESARNFKYTAKKNNWEEEYGDFEIPFQSSIGSVSIEKILLNGSCELTAYDESAALHKQLLEIYLKRYSEIVKTENTDLCPIT